MRAQRRVALEIAAPIVLASLASSCKHGDANTPSAPVVLQVELAVHARLPKHEQVFVVPQGAELPTCSRLRLAIGLSTAAYVYVYQVTPNREVNPLFPDPRVGASERLPAGDSLELPPAPAWFRVDEHDLGAAEIHVVASLDALPNLRAHLRELADDARRIAPARLDCDASGSADSADSCPTSRGIERTSSERSLSMVNVEGEQTIHLVYRFDHLDGPAWAR